MTSPSRRHPPARIDELLRGGETPGSIAGRLNLQVSYVLERAKLVRLDDTGQSVDVTVPQFARNREHCAAVMAFDGYPAIDMRRGRLVNASGRPWAGRSPVFSPAA